MSVLWENISINVSDRQYDTEPVNTEKFREVSATKPPSSTLTLVLGALADRHNAISKKSRKNSNEYRYQRKERPISISLSPVYLHDAIKAHLGEQICRRLHPSSA